MYTKLLSLLKSYFSACQLSLGVEIERDNSQHKIYSTRMENRVWCEAQHSPYGSRVETRELKD